MAVYRIHEKGIWSDSGAEKRLQIALKIRELLMEYFKDNEEVYSRLRNAWYAIVKSLYTQYSAKNMVSELEELEEKVASTYHEKLELLSLPAVKKQPSLSSKVMKIATFCRKLISKAIP
jgi:cysteinyl-tRNA synthetase